MKKIISSITEIRVRYADVDQMKFVYYGKYFEYFEQGRSDLLRSIGMPYPEIEAMGFFLPVLEAKANYHIPAHYDDLLYIKTILKEVPISKIVIEYEVRNSNSEKISATGVTTHCFINSQTGKPTRPPEKFLEKIYPLFI